MTERQAVGFVRHISVYISTVTVFMGVFLLVPALIFWARQLGAGPFLAGLIIAAFSWTKTVGNLFWGGFADKYGRRPPLIIGSAVVAPSLVLMAFAQDPWQLLIIQLFRGFFGGAAAPVLPVLVADLAPRKLLGGRMGVYILVLNVATTIGVPLSGILFDIAPYLPFFAAAAMELMTVLLVVFLVPETLKKPKRTKQNELPTEGSLERFKKASKVWVALFTRRGLVIANIWGFCRYVGRRAVMSVTFPLFADHIGLSATLVGLLGGISGIVRMIGYIPFGALSDRIGRKRQLILGPIIQGCALLLYPSFPFFSGFAGIRTIDATGTSLSGAPVRALLMDWTIRSERGKVQGLNKFSDSLGTTIGGPLVGWITETQGFTSSFLYGAGVMFATSIVVSLIWRTPPTLKEKCVRARAEL